MKSVEDRSVAKGRGQRAKERPIIFSTEMVKAILEGRKTQTRRVIDLNDWEKQFVENMETLLNNDYGFKPTQKQFNMLRVIADKEK